MKLVQSNNNGTLTYNEYNTDVGYLLYVPKNVNADTPIFTYTYGSNKWAGWRSICESLMENGSNSIIIMPNMDWDADWGGNTIAIADSVREEYGISNLNLSGSGFSMGGFGGLVTVAENIKQNPNLDPQVIFFIDDYSDTYYNPNKVLDQELVESLKENNTILFAYCTNRKGKHNYQEYIDAGLNVIQVEPKDTRHIAIKDNFFKNGIYDYMTGASLPQEGYVYKIYNKETGQWEEIEYSKLATIDKLYDYYNIDTLQSSTKRLSSLSKYRIKSDSGIIEQYLNNMVRCIKNASFLSTDIADSSGSSTTNIPSQVSMYVHQYFASVAKSIDKLTNLMDTVAEIDPAYRETDQNLLSMLNK